MNNSWIDNFKQIKKQQRRSTLIFVLVLSIVAGGLGLGIGFGK